MPSSQGEASTGGAGPVASPPFGMQSQSLPSPTGSGGDQGSLSWWEGPEADDQPSAEALLGAVCEVGIPVSLF